MDGHNWPEWLMRIALSQSGSFLGRVAPPAEPAGKKVSSVARAFSGNGFWSVSFFLAVVQVWHPREQPGSNPTSGEGEAWPAPKFEPSPEPFFVLQVANEKAEEDEFRRKMMEKFAEDDRIEQVHQELIAMDGTQTQEAVGRIRWGLMRQGGFSWLFFCFSA